MKENVFSIMMLTIICTLCFCGIGHIIEKLAESVKEDNEQPKEQKTSVIIQAFNPIYEIDPRQKDYIVKSVNGYDTIQHGQLENFIINDNE